MQQAVLQVRAIDRNVVGEDEPSLEGAPSDATVQHLGLRLLLRRPAGDNKIIVRHDHQGSRGGSPPPPWLGDRCLRQSSRCCKGDSSAPQQSMPPRPSAGPDGRNRWPYGTAEQNRNPSCKTSCYSKVTYWSRPNGPAPGAVSEIHPGIPKDLDLANAPAQFKRHATYCRNIRSAYFFSARLKELFVEFCYLTTAVDDPVMTGFNRELVVCVLRSDSTRQGPASDRSREPLAQP